MLNWTVENIHHWPSKVVVNGDVLPLEITKENILPDPEWKWSQKIGRIPTIVTSIKPPPIPPCIPAPIEFVTKEEWQASKQKPPIHKNDKLMKEFIKLIDKLKADKNKIKLVLTEHKHFDIICKLIPEMGENCNTNGTMSYYKNVKVISLPIEKVILFQFLLSGHSSWLDDFMDCKFNHVNVTSDDIMKFLITVDE